MLTRLFLLVLLPFALLGQDIMSLTGWIIDFETREPLIGANVTVIGTDYGAASSATGAFRVEFPLNRVPADSILLSVTYIGYQSVFMFIPSVAGPSSIDFYMIQEVINLEEVVVKADRAKSKSRAYPMTVIGREQIDRAATNNVYEMLRRVAGLRITRTGGTSRPGFVSMRGRSKQPLIVIDGVPIPPTYYGWNDIADILTSMILRDIEKIEIVKGRAMVFLYGEDAYNGAILIYTRKF